ncbi:hypothetical protein NKJ84_12820 [Mesorhizobium sp. M0048]|uniref:hypothetical protein n=1 Tax=Mesorhizobium sp. M0048 TaxID=2956860 RepID=UPI00333CF621
MNKLPKKFVGRIAPNLSKYQRIALAHQKSEVVEDYTVTLVKDIVVWVSGYDKYDELTSEHQMKVAYKAFTGPTSAVE